MEDTAYRHEQERLAPATGRLKAKLKEEQIRTRAKSKASGKGGGFMEKIAKVNEAGNAFGTLMMGSGEMSTPAMRESQGLGLGFGQAPSRSSSRRKQKQDYPFGFGF